MTLALLAALLLAAPPAEAQAPARKGKAARAAKKTSGKAAKGARREPSREAAAGRVSIADLQPAPTGPVAVRPVAVRPLDREGVVRNVLKGRAYLDAGTREGLAAGQTIELRRRGQSAASCKVEAVTERNAICSGSGIRPGDTFAVNPKAAGSLPAELPSPVPPEEQARRLATLQRVGYALVDFKSNRVVELPDRLRRNEVSISHFSFLSDSGNIHQERVDARAYSTEAWRGSRLDVDLTAVGESQPSSTERYEPGRRAHLWVREASLSWDAPGSPWRLAAGRVLPWLLPGGPTFDGAQAGWRPRRGAEVGFFGGAVPDALTTAPGSDRATGGAYWSVEGLVGPALLRSDGRLAWLRLPGSKSRIEAEATGQAWIAKRLDVSGQVRFGSGDYEAPKKLDSAHVDVSWVQPFWITAYASYRYDESRVDDVVAPSLYPGRTRQALGGLSYDRLGWLLIRANGGYSRDLSTFQDRGWAGPELAMPRLLGRWGGMSLGYAEELGTWPGRSAWVQGNLALGKSTRLDARASWLMDERPAPLSADHSVGLSLALLSDIRPWLRLRLSALGRYAIPVNESESLSGAWGSSVFAAVEARY